MNSFIRWPLADTALNGDRKRVLLLSYFFPPCDLIGARRPAGLAHWLPEFGWDPVVITAGWGNTQADIIEVPHQDRLQRMREASRSHQAVARAVSAGTGHTAALKTIFRHIIRNGLHWYDCHRGWSAKAIQAGIDAGRKTQVDLVWATCDPFSMAFAAQQIATALQVPYIIDLRDPLPEYLLERTVSRHWLGKAMRGATAVTLAAPMCSTPVLQRARDGGADYCILSGAWQSKHQASESSEKFTLLHAGTLHGQQRDPRPLLDGIAQLVRDVPGFAEDARLCLIGGDSHFITTNPEYRSLEALAVIHGRMPYHDVVRYMRQASVLLIINGPNFYFADPVPGKFYDYLPFDAPVLAVGGRGGILQELLNWSGAGAWAGSSAEVATYLLAQYHAWLQRKVIKSMRDPDALTYLSQQRMAREFAEVFRGVSGRRDIRYETRSPWTR